MFQYVGAVCGVVDVKCLFWSCHKIVLLLDPCDLWSQVFWFLDVAILCRLITVLWPSVEWRTKNGNFQTFFFIFNIYWLNLNLTKQNYTNPKRKKNRYSLPWHNTIRSTNGRIKNRGTEMLNKNSFGTLHNGNFHSVKRLSTSSSSAPVSWVRRQICLSCVCQTELCPEWSPLAGVSSFSPYYKVSKCYTHQNVILIKIKNTV